MANFYAKYPFDAADIVEGTVTSVGLADGSTTPIYSISGSPVTTAGTLTFTLNTESANTVFSGPSSGSAAQPTFRALVTADLPAGTGTVTSVGFSDGSTVPIYTISGSPVTGSGTITETLATQSANLVLSGPTTGSAAQPTFRSLVSADIPTSLPLLTSASTLSTVGTITTGVWNGTATSGSSWITSGTTYTTPANITSATSFKFTLIGGGGGGGSVGTATASAGAAGGGGGGTGIVFLTGLTASTGYTIAIGARGNGGASSGANAGGTGGNTTIAINAVTYTAAGGVGGSAYSGSLTAFAAGGAVTNCTIGIQGQYAPGTLGANATAYMGAGGGSLYGLGAPGQFAGATGGGSIGVTATGFGAGGGGARCTQASPSAESGGNATAGAILVEWQN